MLVPVDIVATPKQIRLGIRELLLREIGDQIDIVGEFESVHELLDVRRLECKEPTVVVLANIGTDEVHRLVGDIDYHRLTKRLLILGHTTDHSDDLTGAHSVAGFDQLVANLLDSDSPQAAPTLDDVDIAVLFFVECGFSNSQIGQALHLSPGTVRNRLSRASVGFGTNNRIEAASCARSLGLLC